MNLSKNTKNFLLFLSAFTVGLVLLVSRVDLIASLANGLFSLLMPFITGACLAFILGVPMRLFDRIFSKTRKDGRPLISDGARLPLCLLCSILLVLLLLILFAMIVLPQIVDTVATLAVSIIRFVPTAQDWITSLMAQLEEYPQIHDAIAPMIPDLNQIATTAISLIQRYAGIATSTIVSNISALFGSATDVIVIIVFAIYILLQKKTLSRQCKKLIYAFLPKAFCDKMLYVARLTHKTFFSYITIQCTEAAILGVLCFAGMLLFRFPYALVISTIMIFCALIPIYGAIISCIIGAFLVLIESPMQALGFVVFILVLQQLETNLIYPRVVSTSINLPPMWVLLTVTVGGGLFGVVGMLTAVPIMSVAYTLLAETTQRRLEARGLNTASPDQDIPSA